MKPMLILAVLPLVSCLQSRQRSLAGFLVKRDPSGADVLVSTRVARTRAGGACFGPNCCVKVSRNSEGACELEAECEETDAPALRHLEVAVVCQEGQDFTHHSFGYGDIEPQTRVTTPVMCAACFAPRKSDFAFARTFRHVKQRRGAKVPAATASLGTETKVERTEADDAPLDLPLAADTPTPEAQRVMLRQAVSAVVPSCPVAPKGLFAKDASPCCGRPVALLEVLQDPGACGTHDDSPPDLCDASCFLALQVVLAQNASTKAQDDDFCSAYAGIETSLASMLNAVCSRSGGQTCATVLSDTALTAGPAVIESITDGPSDASADAADAADDTGSNATSSDALLLTVLQRLRRATQATAVQRALVATGRVAHGAASRKNETVTGLGAALAELCTPCFQKAAGAGLGVVDALVAAFDAKVFADSFVEQSAKDIGQALKTKGLDLGLPEEGRVEAAQVHAVRDLLAAGATGLCSTDEKGAYCLPGVVAARHAGNASLAQSTSGSATCGSRCGKLGAQLALLDATLAKEDPRAGLFPRQGGDELHALTKGLVLLEDGCAKPGEDESKFCVDQFWAYAEGLPDLVATVELWTTGCATATGGGECGDCAQILESLDAFGCCRGAILEGMLLLTARHASLEEWGFVAEGEAKHLGAEGELAAIRSAIRTWASTCERPAWQDPCGTCTKQVALSVAMPAGVTEDELRSHQFRIEEALRRDVALTVREPLANLKVLEWAPAKENVSVVLGLRGDSCTDSAFAASALAHRVETGGVVFAHTPEALAEVADPVEEVVEFALHFSNASGADALTASVKEQLAHQLAVEAASLEVAPTTGEGGVTIAGSVKGSGRMALAKDLAEKLEDEQSSLRQELAGNGLARSEVAISIVPNEPALGLENRTAQESFGPDRCVHVSQEDGECVLTTRNCDLKALEEFEVAFLCKDGDKHEKHSYGRGGSLGSGPAAFEKHEAFKTGIKCAECLPPPTEPSAPHPSAAATGWALGALALFYAL